MLTRISDKALYAVTFALSIAIFVYFLTVNCGTIIYDETGYWGIARLIRANGLLAYSDPLRTYLYPVGIAAVAFFTGANPVVTKLILAVLQYGLYAYTVFLCARTAAAVTGTRAAYRATVVLGLTNPYLIAACTLMLTDLVAACCIAIALIVLTTADVERPKNAFVVWALLFASVMIRPSNAVFVPVFFAIAGFLIVRRKRRPWSMVVAAAASLVLFVPQIYINWSNFDEWNPLVHTHLYDMQAELAARLLKYGTVGLHTEAAPLVFASPFPQHPDGTTIFALAAHHPLEFAFVFVVHMFGVFDWGFLNTYIYDLSALPRIVPSIYLYAQWFLIGAGVVAALRGRYAIAAGSYVFAVAVYVLFIGTTEVESRFGFPIYLALLPFAGLGVDTVARASGSRKQLVRYASLFAVFASAMLFGSYLLDASTGRIDWF